MTPKLSVVVPAFNEEENLPVLHERVAETLDGLGVTWELIVVDDHSGDATFAVVERLAAADARVRGFRLARNGGSHAAIACGLEHAEGEACVVLAADLQDPPTVIARMLEARDGGAQVVWAVRERREGERASTLAAARLFYWLMRRFGGMPRLPEADFFLIDRAVMDALRASSERNVNLFALIAWMGFRQAEVSYAKQPRHAGRSGWTLDKKVKLAVDSLTAFSYKPIRLVTRLGAGAIAVAVVLGGWLLVRAVGRSAPGWLGVLTVVVFLGGVNLLALGLLGEYLWRALDEARGRPRWLVEARVDRRQARVL